MGKITPESETDDVLTDDIEVVVPKYDSPVIPYKKLVGYKKRAAYILKNNPSSNETEVLDRATSQLAKFDSLYPHIKEQIEKRTK